MSIDTWALILVGVLGALCAFIERRDGWRFASLAERLGHEVADLRERVARLEERSHAGEQEPQGEAPTPWWAFWRRP